MYSIVLQDRALIINWDTHFARCISANNFGMIIILKVDEDRPTYVFVLKYSEFSDFGSRPGSPS